MAQPPLTEKGLVYEASLGQLRTSFAILSAIHATATLFHVAAPEAESALLETQGRMWLCSSSGSARVQHPAPLQSLREPFPPPAGWQVTQRIVRAGYVRCVIYDAPVP